MLANRPAVVFLYLALPGLSGLDFQAELAKAVEAAIAKLPDQDCEIIVMRHYEQLSNQEIAQALSLTEPAASMRYLRAIRRLKELMVNPNASSDDENPLGK